MNYSAIRYILGYVLMIEGVLLLLPFLIGVIYWEEQGKWYLITALVCIIIGFLITRKKPDNFLFYLKEGCVATASSWILLSILGALPFWLSGEIPKIEDALFETVSGFTTTGASILSDVERLSHCALFWRSFTHWIGGMGVLVFLLMIIPLGGGSNMNLMRAESPGPSVGKLVPRIKSTAQILYVIYFGMTVVELILLLLGGMPLFDSVTLSFGTAGTGGFGIRNDSIGGYSPYVQWVIAIFMLLFAVNFNAYYMILLGKWKKGIAMEEVRCYFIIVFAAIAIIFCNILELVGNVGDALRHASFQVATLISSTGYSTTDFDRWPQTAKMVLVLLMLIGACAGSTGGGIKVSRIVILVKTVAKELHSYIHPKSIRKVNFEYKPVAHEVVRATNVFFVTFMLVFTASAFLISLEGKDLVTTFTSVLACFNNMGPGLALVGPTQNFGPFTPFSKLVFMFDMIAGRLELFPLLILFHPALWKDAILHHK
ncbi:MAG: TrkH family potassium uptake protein [Lachnospiraceae bacterium]|nr:TrkH family potassium uptake protein [Lachnospiraceae bacterium]